jgi:hypothetical protein
MPFATENVLEMLMAINSFGPRFDPQSIPSYSDWLANNTFDPFGPDPFSPIPTAGPGVPFHSQSQGESRVKEGTNVGSRVDRGQRSSEDMLQVPKEVSDLPSVDHEFKTNGIYHRDPDSHSRKSGLDRPLTDRESRSRPRPPPPGYHGS